MRTQPLIRFYSALAPDNCHHHTTELLIKWIWDLETAVSLDCLPTVRDYFRFMWE